MTHIEAAKQVVETSGAILMRARKDDPNQYDVKPLFTGKKKGWFFLDSFTASAMLVVYNKLTSENQEKVNQINILRYINFCWSSVK